MDQDRRAAPAAAGVPSREILAERLQAAGSRRGLRRGSRWLALPATLAIYAALVALAVLLGRSGGAPRARPLPAVTVLLQEGPEPVPGGAAPVAGGAAGPAGPAAAPVPGPVPAPRPAFPAPAPGLPVPAPAAQPEPAAAAETATRPPLVETPVREGPGTGWTGPAGAAAAAEGGAGGGTGGGPSGNPGGPGPGGPRRAAAAGPVELGIAEVKVRYRPPDPDYPALARRNGIQGAVTVGVTIGADGVPIRAQALGGPGLLRAAAEGNALAWRFEPYRVAGVATICWIPLPFTFRLKP